MINGPTGPPKRARRGGGEREGRGGGTVFAVPGQHPQQASQPAMLYRPVIHRIRTWSTPWAAWRTYCTGKQLIIQHIFCFLFCRIYTFACRLYMFVRAKNKSVMPHCTDK